MKYMRYELSNGYTGCTRKDVIAFEDKTTEKEIYDYLSDLLYEYGEEYESVACISYGKDDEEQEIQAYYEDLSFTCEKISKEQYEELK